MHGETGYSLVSAGPSLLFSLSISEAIGVACSECYSYTSELRNIEIIVAHGCRQMEPT